MRDLAREQIELVVAQRARTGDQRTKHRREQQRLHHLTRAPCRDAIHGAILARRYCRSLSSSLPFAKRSMHQSLQRPPRRLRMPPLDLFGGFRAAQVFHHGAVPEGRVQQPKIVVRPRMQGHHRRLVEPRRGPIPVIVFLRETHSMRRSLRGGSRPSTSDPSLELYSPVR